MYTSLSKQSDNDNCHKNPLPTPAWDMYCTYSTSIVETLCRFPVYVLCFQLIHQTNEEIFRSYYPAAARPKTI